MSVWVVLLAGGRGERLRRDVNKVYLPLRGRQMLHYPLDTFLRSPQVDGLVVVVRPGEESHVGELLAGTAAEAVRVVAGGASRHRSEHLGIAALAEEIEAGVVEWIAIHDGARPFVSLELFGRVLEEARRRGGAIPALGVAGPLYRREGRDVTLLDTRSVYRAQTPQVFRAVELWGGFQSAQQEGFEGVDTAETVERFTALEVGLVPGDRRNIKVTFVEDLLEAEDLAGAFHEGRWNDGSPDW